MKTANRLYYLDNLRVVLTVLVIAHHVGQAYGPTGGWWPVQEETRAALLGPFFTVNRSFFMSLFFMISGYFLVGAYERGGARAFVLGRLRRLGIPVLAFAVLMLLARIYLFGERITRWDEVFNAGHLWYLEHLLLFSLVYALWRRIRGAGATADLSRRPLPGWLAYLAFTLGVAVCSALVRIWSPIDRWFNLLGFFRVAFADVPRDLAFFLVGVLAWRRAWFERFPARAGIAWLAAGLAAAAAWYAYDLGHGRLLPLNDTAFGVVYPLWEILLCLGMCIGLTVVFREAANFQGALGKWLADNQYSAYFWHPLLIVALQMAVLGIPLGPLAKFALVTVVGVALVFAWSHLLRLLRPVRAVL